MFSHLPHLDGCAQDVDLHTYARMVLAVLDLSPATGAAGLRSSAASASLAESLHSLFALYLEFKNNPAFQQHQAVFAAAAPAAQAPL